MSKGYAFEIRPNNQKDLSAEEVKLMTKDKPRHCPQPLLLCWGRESRKLAKTPFHMMVYRISGKKKKFNSPPPKNRQR